MPNRLAMRNLQALPNQVSTDGGTISIQFQARTSQAPARATVDYSVASGFPFEVTEGASATADVDVTETTVAQDVTIGRNGGAAVSFVQMEVTGRISGDVDQKLTCFVWIDQPLSEQLRDFRSANGLTQNALAVRMGVSASTISRIENGSTPSSRIEQAIAEEMS